MNARTLFEGGSLMGPWWVRLGAFHEGMCVVGLSWHRYLDRFEVCLHPLPFVSLQVMRRLARTLAPVSRAWCLFRRGSGRDPLQIAAVIASNDWRVGATWFQDFEGLELAIHPLPMLVIFYTRTRNASDPGTGPSA